MKPPVHSTLTLRIFVLAARFLSLTRTAEAVHLTQGAVSKHIRALEDTLGAPLFLRHARGLHLTEAGEVYLEHIAPAVEAMEHAAARVADLRQGGHRIALGAPPAVAPWVTVCLAAFMARHPELTVVMRPRQAMAPRSIGAASSGVLDAEIRFGEAGWPGMHGRYLLGREATLVGSPRLLARIGLHEPSEIPGCGAPLLRHLHVPEVWRCWAGAMGVSEAAIDAAPASDCEQYSVLLAAAEAGLGLAVAPRVLVAEALAAGTLAAPFGEVQRVHPGYHLVMPEGQQGRRPLALLAEFLAREGGRATRAACAQTPGRTAIPYRNG